VTRVVLDTNILVSAFLWPGPPSKVFRLAAGGQIQALTCKELETELTEVLSRPKFQLSSTEVLAILREFQRIAIPVIVTSDFKAVPEDPDDDHLLRLAVDGSAQVLVTGDQHLLSLSKFREIEIVTASEFMKRYTSSEGPREQSS
jgi:putative PIN family toxin of toxin-antitoxin system